jgi:ABC-2 type transport system permease protein
MNAFLHHFSFEFRTGIRNRQMLFMNYLFPLGVYFLVGLIMVEINPLFGETAISSMSVFAIAAVALLGIPDPLVNANVSGIFRSYKINGVPSISILTIPGLTTSLHLLVVVGIIILTAPPLMDAPLPTDWFGFILVLFVTLLAMVSLGLLIGVVASSSRMTVLLSQLIFLPSMLVGGIMMPHDFLPETVQKISLILPPSHAMIAFQGLAQGVETFVNPYASLFILLAGGIIAFGLAVFLFNWDPHNRTSKGHPLMALLAVLPYVVGLFMA